jgi:hypothetical protein
MGRKTHFRQRIKPNTAHRQPCAWPYAYQGTAEACAYMEGERKGYKVTLPETGISRRKRPV